MPVYPYVTPMQPAPAPKKRLLVVDDDPAIHGLMKGVLSQEYDVLTAVNADEALSLLKQEKPDLVLCDVIMPGMDGLRLLELLTEQDPGLKVVMMTGETSPQTVVASLRYRAYDFLAKPFTLEQLRTLLDEALESNGEHDFRVRSATPQWIEVETPCSLAAARRLFRFMAQLKTGLTPQAQSEIAAAFRELLQNAVEHGGKNDPKRYVSICYLRLRKALLYVIRDPGEGFRPEELEHAAITNPPDDPLRHVSVREQKNLRPGGFGLFLTSQLVDELIYNQKRNEVVFVKYIDE